MGGQRPQLLAGDRITTEDETLLERIGRLEERIQSLKDLAAERDRGLDERAAAQDKAAAFALQAAERAVAAALASAEKAVATAQTAQVRVNEKQNEFRQALLDQQATFLPRETYEQAHQDLGRRVEALEHDSGRGIGLASGLDKARARTLGLIAAAGTILGIVAFLITQLS